MSYGQLGDAAIPNRYRVEYAPTGRAACKGCGAAIAEGTPKLGEKVRSPWHDGFDMHFAVVTEQMHGKTWLPTRVEDQKGARSATEFVFDNVERGTIEEHVLPIALVDVDVRALKQRTSCRLAI